MVPESNPCESENGTHDQKLKFHSLKLELQYCYLDVSIKESVMLTIISGGKVSLGGPPTISVSGVTHEICSKIRYICTRTPINYT